VAIEPAAYNHGATRTLAAGYASGEVLVFVNQRSLPADENWLANLVEPLDDDPEVAGVCSRVQPRPDADLLTAREVERDLNASPRRAVRAIVDWQEYRASAPPQVRLLINFHTIGAAIRPSIFARIPFRTVRTIGEDITWAREVLEAGYRIQHEPSSVVLHSHNYSLQELLQRNYDDGLANRELVGHRVDSQELETTVLARVLEDWRYLEQCQLAEDELARWRVVAAWRRLAQAVGQWLGTNQEQLAGDLGWLCSLTERIKTGEAQAAPTPSPSPRGRGEPAGRGTV
jgi:rhamnosyltransferase